MENIVDISVDFNNEYLFFSKYNLINKLGLYFISFVEKETICNFCSDIYKPYNDFLNFKK
jgi:hypothetical protein